MPEFFGSDGPYFLQFLVIFLVILVLLMGAALLFRRLVGRGLSLSAGSGQRGRQPRLGIVDIYELDRQRQLILLRRDNVEHLLLVGGPNDVVVERNVIRSAGTRMPGENLMRPEPASELPPPTSETLPRPAEPPFEMPVVVPPPLPGEHAVPAARTPPLDPALFAPESEPFVPPDPAEPARSRIGISQVGRILRRTPPPLVNPRPERLVEPAETQPLAAPETEGAPLRAPVMAGEDPRPVDPAVLSDMARQLETALRRPSSAVTPPPGRPAEPEAALAGVPHAPPAEPDASPPDPVAAAMAASQVLSPPFPAESSEPKPEATIEAAPAPKTEPTPKPTPPAKPDVTVKPAPAANPTPAERAPALAEAKPAATPKPAPEAKPTAAPVADPKPAPTAPKPAAIEPKPAPLDTKPAPRAVPAPSEKPAKPADEVKPTQQPFTLEEIETEFARLLGRQIDKN